MPRYFFDLDDGANRHRDLEGDDLPDVKAARAMALSCLMDMIGDKFTKDTDRNNMTVEVRDRTGQVIYTACLSLTVRSFD